MDLTFHISAFVALFVIIDPIGLAPVFLALTQGSPTVERRALGRRAIFMAFGLLTLFGLLGETVLSFVGISFPAFRIAGGILLFLTALDMLFERRTARRDHTAGEEERPDPSVFPLAIPLLAGPGAPLSLRSEIVDWFPLVAVARSDHPLAGRRSVSGASLTAADLILRRRGSGTLDVIEMALAEHELGVAGRTTEVSSTAAARLTAMNGGGVALLPAPAVAADLAAGRLVEIRLRNLTLRQPIRLAWKGSSPGHPAARRFRDRLRDLGRPS